MARLPMLAEISDLRFTSSISVAFTIRWDAADSYAHLIDEIRVRFLLSNLLDLGADDDAVAEFMEELDDWAATTASALTVPAGWASDLALYHIGRTYTVSDADLSAARMSLAFTDPSLRQRFVRAIAQSRTC